MDINKIIDRTNQKEVFMMKYYVNENCIGCGLCVNTCPEVFEMTDEGVAKAMNISTDMDEAQEALEGCPVDAIEEV